MQQAPIVTENRAETDAMWDTSHPAMAARFGARTRQLLRDGRDVRATARLAAQYAFLADTSLRIETVLVVNRRPELVH